MQQRDVTTSATRSGWRAVAGVVAAMGALLVLSCLYALSWWSDPFGDRTFLDLASHCGYGSDRCGPLTTFGASFFVWGHVMFAVVAVATAAVVWLRPLWPSVAAGTLSVFGAWWMASALSQPGVINTGAARTLAYWGTALLVVAVIIRLLEAAQQQSSASGRLERTGV